MKLIIHLTGNFLISPMEEESFIKKKKKKTKQTNKQTKKPKKNTIVSGAKWSILLNVPDDFIFIII
jgi:hypothetical protein